MQLDLTAAGRAGLATVLVLARDPYTLLTREELQLDTGAPSEALGAALELLAGAGLVAEIEEGVHLERPPAELTVLELLRLLEPRLGPDGCLVEPHPCDGSCAVHPVWHAALGGFLEPLQRTTVAQLVGAGA